MHDCAEKIMIVMHDLPLGGTERIAVRLANRWAGLGRQVTIFCGDASGPTRALLDDSVEVVETRPAIPRMTIAPLVVRARTSARQGTRT